MQIDSTISTLTARLARRISQYSEVNPQWVQYVKDHRQYLLTTAYDQYMTKEDAWIYRYRPEEYLANLSYDTSITWLVLWLNQLTTETFIGLNSFKLPEISTLRDMYSMFSSCQFAAAKALE